MILKTLAIVGLGTFIASFLAGIIGLIISMLEEREEDD